jgi:hypothetical protein
MPTVWNATEYGAFWSISGVDTIEHKVSAMRTYKTVHIVIEPSNPMGMSFPGFFVCSAIVKTASKPKYAKKSTDTALKISLTP